MTTAMRAAPLSWATFAITETRWVVHASAWSVVLWAVTTYCPWLATGPGVFVQLGVLAAFATGYTGRATPPLPPATIIRYALVDVPFVALAAPWIIMPVKAALGAANLLPQVGPHAYGLLPTAVFLGTFYAALGVIGHARSRPRPAALAPLGVAVAVAAMLVVQGYRPAIEYRRTQEARQAGVTRYESATGRAVDKLDSLRIGTSLHGFDNRVTSLERDAKGRLLASGGFSFYGGHDARGFVRLEPDGRLDPTFAALPPGDPAMLAPDRFRIARDGAIVTHQPRSGLARLLEDGTIDKRFQPDLRTESPEPAAVESFELFPDGSVLLAPSARFANSAADRCLLKIGPSGERERAFEEAAMQSLYGPPASRPTPTACAIHWLYILPSGQVLLAGAFRSTGQRPGLVRLNADGSLDETYRPHLETSAVSLWHVAPAGEVFAAAYVPVPGKPGALHARLTKLLPGGEVDKAFSVPDGTLFRIEALAALPSGPLIVAGSLAPGDYGAIMRLTPQGALDPTFGGAAGLPRVDGFVTTLQVQADGRVVLAGEFLQVRQGSTKAPRHNIARLLADGAHDATFEPR